MTLPLAPAPSSPEGEAVLQDGGANSTNSSVQKIATCAVQDTSIIERHLPPTHSTLNFDFNVNDPTIRTSRPPLLEILKLIPLAARVGAYVYNEHKFGRDPIFDLSGIQLQPPIPRSNAGVPCGGIGGGSIGRGIRGEFRRWSLSPGRYRHTVVYPNQFHCKVDDKAVVLSAENVADVPESLRCWNWGSKRNIDIGERSTYHALYPRSWTVFKDPTNSAPGVTIIQRQISPVLPHNYTTSSLPVVVFAFTVVNEEDKQKDVSLMFTFANDEGFDSRDEKSNSVRNRSAPQVYETESIQGVTMRQKIKRMVSYEVGVGRRGSKVGGGEGANGCDCGLGTVFGCCSGERQDDDGVEFYEETYDFSIATATKGVSSAPAPAPASASASASAPASASASASASTFDSTDHLQTQELWENFSKRGSLHSKEKIGGDDALSGSEPDSGAICQKVIVPPKSSVVVEFALSWDTHNAAWGTGKSVRRRHSTFFPNDSELASAAMCDIALKSYGDWEQKIESWQQPILNNERLPEWFRTMVFNELYYLSDGGSVWTESKGRIPNTLTQSVDSCEVGVSLSSEDSILGGIDEIAKAAVLLMEKVDDLCVGAQGDPTIVGQFFYLEGHEYIMYNTSDVHFYASFALSKNFPELEMSIQRDFSDSVPASDGEVRKLLAEGEIKPRKVEGALVHDAGSPSEEPISKYNSYNFQDVSRWKDLPSKFVLMVYRSYTLGGGLDFLKYCFSSMNQAMQRVEDNWVRPEVGIVENEGFPDQTYDVWIASGVSAYTGGLYVAALFAMEKVCSILDSVEDGKKFGGKAKRAKAAYTKLLWNGTFFNYSTENSTSIMSDQLCGQWWARSCGLEDVVEDLEKVRTTLRTIYEHNVLKFSILSGKGNSGAVNGMLTNGKIDTTCIQSQEVWTGTTYGLAALMVQTSKRADDEDLFKKAMHTAEGILSAGWLKFGFSFATPEAWDKTGGVRSLGYMRPLCIWSIIDALDEEEKPLEKLKR